MLFNEFKDVKSLLFTMNNCWCGCRTEVLRRYVQGHNPKNKGKHFTEEHKDKIRLKLLGNQNGHFRIHTKHSEESKGKISAALKGRKLTEECKIKISDALRGQPKSLEHKLNRLNWLNSEDGKIWREKMKLRFSGSNNYFFGKKLRGNLNGFYGKTHTKECLDRLCKIQKGIKRSDEFKQKVSLANIGKNNSMFGKPCPKAKREWYRGIAFRSSWEVIYAKWLDSNNYHWKYEPQRFYFEGKPFTYLPDFWVAELNSYVEIKGWFRDNDKEKLDSFQQEHPLILITNIKLYM